MDARVKAWGIRPPAGRSLDPLEIALDSEEDEEMEEEAGAASGAAAGAALAGSEEAAGEAVEWERLVVEVKNSSPFRRCQAQPGMYEVGIGRPIIPVASQHVLN